MITKEKIIYILENFCYTIEDKAGDKIKVIDENDFDKIANLILNVCENCEDVNFCTIENCCLKDARQ